MSRKSSRWNYGESCSFPQTRPPPPGVLAEEKGGQVLQFVVILYIGDVPEELPPPVNAPSTEMWGPGLRHRGGIIMQVLETK